jgi:hypothetical protein
MPMEPSMLLRHRLSTSIVLAALAATAAVFAFARPQYHDPFPGRQVDLSYAKPPVAGWRWADGTPGFRYGRDEDAWNAAKVRLSDLAPARQAGIDPANVRVLGAQRARDGALFALVAGSGAGERTCIGAVVASAPVRFECDLRTQTAVVVAAPRPPERTARYGTLYPLYLLGVARAEVTRVRLDVAGLQHGTLYARKAALPYWWGAFGAALELPRRWHGMLTFYGAHGRLALLSLSWSSPPTFTHV